jgi:hypothetical protein
LYLNVLSILWCILIYLKVFECTHSIFEYIWMYLQYVYGVFQCVYNILQCIYRMFQCISMCLNVFNNIVIGISPSHSHCNVFSMHIHLHIFFSFYTMIPFQHAISLQSLFFHWNTTPTFILSMKNYTSILTFYVYTSPNIPRSTFQVTSCMQHSGTQVIR